MNLNQLVPSQITPQPEQLAGGWRMLRLLLGVLALGFTAPAAATTTSANVNCRKAPDASSRLVRQIPRGTSVQVAGRANGWSLLSKDDCWVLSRYLIEDGAYVPNLTADQPTDRVTRAAPAQGHSYRSRPVAKPRASIQGRQSAWKKPRRTSRRSNSYGFGGSSCPCSGRNICVGPRGGRYCITSGGNKRYGV